MALYVRRRSSNPSGGIGWLDLERAGPALRRPATVLMRPGNDRYALAVRAHTHPQRTAEAEQIGGATKLTRQSRATC